MEYFWNPNKNGPFQMLQQQPQQSSSVSSSKTPSGSRKRKSTNPQPVLDFPLFSISSLTESAVNNIQPENGSLKTFSTSQPSTSREESPYAANRGRPPATTPSRKVTSGFERIPAFRCTYKKHQIKGTPQRLWILTDDDGGNQGYEYAYYTKSKNQDGHELYGFYCMGCEKIRKRREFDAAIKFESDGKESFMAAKHLRECEPKPTVERYERIHEPEACDELRLEIRELVASVVREEVNKSLAQIREVVQQEIRSQLQQAFNNATQ